MIPWSLVSIALVKEKSGLHLCGVTRRSIAFGDKLGQTLFNSLFRSMSHRCCAKTPVKAVWHETYSSYQGHDDDRDSQKSYASSQRQRIPNELPAPLTRCQLDLEGCANQGHERGGEMHRVVVRNRHVHPDQTLTRAAEKDKAALWSLQHSHAATLNVRFFFSQYAEKYPLCSPTVIIHSWF